MEEEPARSGTRIYRRSCSGTASIAILYNVQEPMNPVKMYIEPHGIPAKTDRATVLAAAMQQVENEGVENLAIRSVASSLGLAPNALYHYFESLGALGAAVAEEARLQMLEIMQKAAGRKGPAKTIRAISEAYLRFAHQQPRVFALYLKTSGAHSASPQCTRNTEFFLEQVTRVYGEKRAGEAAHALWASLHGLAVLREAGVLTAAQASISLKFSLQMWIDGALSSSGDK